MAGKAYTMREMRAIVEYLTERKAYGEIKGRKMWMEYANSEKTTRSWQSLKETFIKRILPDIQNPYYKLSMDQVLSFKQGYDVAEREKSNRLEFRTANVASNGDSQNEIEQSNKRKDKELPGTSCDNELPTTCFDNEPPTTTSIDEELGKATGEDIISAKIPSRSRSSADTVVLEYENADELQRVLESPKNTEIEGKSKTLKDLLTFEYSAPLTPLVRELLDDFETESEASDKEPQLNIDENPQEITINNESEPIENIQSDNHNINHNPESAIEIYDTENAVNTTTYTKEVETSVTEETAQKDSIQEKGDKAQRNKSLKLKKSQKNIFEENADTHESSTETNLQDNDIADAESKKVTNAEPKHITEFVTAESVTAEPKDITESVTAESNSKTTKFDTTKNKKDCNNTIANTGNSMQNTGNTSSDTILPNNQEAFDDSKNTTQKTSLDKTTNITKKENEKAHVEQTGNIVEKTNEKVSRKRSTSQDSKESKKQKLLKHTSKESKKDENTIPIIEINDTPTEHDTAPALEKNPVSPDTNIIRIDIDITTTNDTENQSNDLLKIVPKNTVKPSTSNEKDISINVAKGQEKDIVGGRNPCLLSVSLFDEQFKNTKYSDTDSDDEATPAPKQNQNKSGPHTETNGMKERNDKPQKEANNNKEMAVVKNVQNNDGTLESTRDCRPQRQGIVNKSNNIDNKAIILQREKVLANVFGFAHGLGPTSRKRQISHRRRSHHHRRRHSKNESNSSEWTSESDSESYVTPPRARRNRPTKKYMKPKSSRILQDPEEGMLYVVFGKNIYPLVKDGKHIKNFLTYRPDSESDMEEESYWKKKYVEEKKKAEEIKSLLKESRERKIAQTDGPISPILPSPSRRSTTSQAQRKRVQNGNSKELAVAPAVENKVEPKDNKMVLKIAAKDGMEYCLEGGWTQISNAMPQMVKMLQNESPAPQNVKPPNSPTNKSVERQISKVGESVEVSSGVSSPAVGVIDPEAHERVNKLEKEIFNEIREREKEEQLKQIQMESANVTKRKHGRPRRDSSSSSIIVTQSPTKRSRISKSNSTESKQSTTKPTRRSKRVSKPKLDASKEQIEPKKDEIGIQMTGNKTKITEQKTDITEQTETTEQKASNQTVRTKMAKKQQNDIVDKEPPQRRESLRLSKQKETSGHISSLRSSDVSPVGTRSSARLIRSPNKYETDSSASDIRPRSKKSTSKETTELHEFDEENARFMFPPTTRSNKKSPREKKNGSLPRINIIPPQETSSRNSIDRTQGYQDSDGGPLKFNLPRKKKRLSLTIRKKYATRSFTRRQSHPIFFQELSSDSNNSLYFVPLRKSQSCLNSKVYRTESFDLLLPKKKQSFNKLERIEETTHPYQFDSNIRHFNSISKDSDKSSHENSNILVEVGSSSISLPLSPELSIVENLSISRDMIKCNNHPTINEVQSNMSKHPMDFSEYMISNLNVSIPLMNQQCVLHKSTDKKTPKKNVAKSAQFSDPLLTKECSVRIENLTLSESLDQKLRNLLLESCKKSTRANSDKENAMEVDQSKKTTAKKPRQRVKKQIPMEVDQSKAVTPKKTRLRNKENAMNVDESKVASIKNTRAKKRSSTPQKKKAAQKTKSKEPIIEEEHIESCSVAGRKSCPPVMTALSVVENANNFTEDTHNTVKNNTIKVNAKKKKDVIKVKIQRPKGNNQSKEKLRASVGNVSATSTYTDSGINDTGTISGMFLKEIEDSVDLIHNHSETCLLANECIGDSVQFVENSDSIISLSSTDRSVISELQKILDDAANLSGDLFTKPVEKAPSELNSLEEFFESSETVYHTPVATNSSLITEDLSDELPDPPTLPTKWHFLSEDDNTQASSSWNMRSFGSNLTQIFPIACAVPNLSTISEMSKENEDSRKTN